MKLLKIQFLTKNLEKILGNLFFHICMFLFFKKTRLVVGACWHGRQRELVQFFRGHLASMWLWPGQVLNGRQVHCAHGLHERLQIAEHLELTHGAVSVPGKFCILFLKNLKKIRYNILR